MKRTQLIIIVLGLALAGAVGWRILKSKSPAQTGGEHVEAGPHGSHDEREEHGREGHVKLTIAQRKNANLTVEEAAPAKIKTSLSVYGKVGPNEDALAHVMPRFPGIVKTVKKRLGDHVEAGEVLAQIESNESLKVYDVVSEITGTVIHRNVALGEFVKDDKMIFSVADLSTVWIDLNIFRQDFGLLREGQPVELHTGVGHVSGEEHIAAKIDYISPFGTEGSQTMLARCVVQNAAGVLRPGLFVDGEIITGEVEAPVAVKNSAIQTVANETVVFVEKGDVFEAREVELGVKDNERVEVVSGLLPGDRYAAENSFIIKAELGKGEAGHEH
ncbi:MAG TPA: efflux RND transporter periplasmic adaptor subunit [Chthoniobacterales bacterium]|nr:efflux RND transporter periplasmic adaptor subunit [Chthoniobacterales bacterium]